MNRCRYSSKMTCGSKGVSVATVPSPAKNALGVDDDTAEPCLLKMVISPLTAVAQPTALANRRHATA